MWHRSGQAEQDEIKYLGGKYFFFYFLNCKSQLEEEKINAKAGASIEIMILSWAAENPAFKEKKVELREREKKNSFPHFFDCILFGLTYSIRGHKYKMLRVKCANMQKIPLKLECLRFMTNFH